MLTTTSGELNEEYIEQLVGVISNLHKKGYQVVLVSSGAAAAGKGKLQLCSTSKHLPIRQTFSAVGQPVLMNGYIQHFDRYGIHVAQALLTRYDFENRQHFLNTRDLLLNLLTNGVIPIINENDVTSVYELQFGDNDRIAAQVSNIIGADILLLLTDVDGLYDRNPKKYNDAKRFSQITDIHSDLAGFINDDVTSLMDDEHAVSFGGMKSKVISAHLCQIAGIEAVILSGDRLQDIEGVLTGADIGTRFLPTEKKQEYTKKWIISQAVDQGVVIDDGAVTVLKAGKSSLLAVGVVECLGNFKRGDSITIYDTQKNQVGFGLTNYNNEILDQIKGHSSDEFFEILGFNPANELVHKDNLVMI